MADRLDYFFRQRVTEAELDLGFELLEKADRNLAADIGVHGILGGAEPTPHEPVADLSVDLTGPARAYDRIGQRVFFGTGQTVNCSIDSAGIPTEVTEADQERWLGVFLRFDRLLSEPRTDGNSQQVFFRRDESFELVVRQAPSGPAGAGPRVPLVEGELLLCDVRRTPGQAQILAGDLDTARRQLFVFARGDAVEIVSELWSVLAPAVQSVQSALDSVDSVLTQHFSASARRHRATDVTFAPGGTLESTTVQGAIEEIVTDLSSVDETAPGASRVGADGIGGSPNALTPGTVRAQLAQLLATLNGHVGAAAGAHNASAIAAATHAYIEGTSVQAQLQELVAALQSQSFGLGASRIGDGALAGAPNFVPPGTVREQLAALLAALNTHTGAAHHDSRYFTREQSDERFYNVGQQVADAQTLQGNDPTAFALASHRHDDRYLRPIAADGRNFAPGAQREVIVISEAPDLVTVAYRFINSLGTPLSTRFIQGEHSASIDANVSSLEDGHHIAVRNGSAELLHIEVVAYGRGAVEVVSGGGFG